MSSNGYASSVNGTQDEENSTHRTSVSCLEQCLGDQFAPGYFQPGSAGTPCADRRKTYERSSLPRDHHSFLVTNVHTSPLSVSVGQSHNDRPFGHCPRLVTQSAVLIFTQHAVRFSAVDSRVVEPQLFVTERCAQCSEDRFCTDDRGCWRPLRG